LEASNEEEFEEVVRAEIEVPNDVTNPPDASNETAGNFHSQCFILFTKLSNGEIFYL